MEPMAEISVARMIDRDANGMMLQRTRRNGGDALSILEADITSFDMAWLSATIRIMLKPTTFQTKEIITAYWPVLAFLNQTKGFDSRAAFANTPSGPGCWGDGIRFADRALWLRCAG